MTPSSSFSTRDGGNTSKRSQGPVDVFGVQANGTASLPPFSWVSILVESQIHSYDPSIPSELWPGFVLDWSDPQTSYFFCDFALFFVFLLLGMGLVGFLSSTRFNRACVTVNNDDATKKKMSSFRVMNSRRFNLDMNCLLTDLIFGILKKAIK